MFLLDFYYILGSEPETRISSTNCKLAKSSDCSTFSTPKPSLCPTVPSTGELYRTLRLIPDGRYFSIVIYCCFYVGLQWAYFHGYAFTDRLWCFHFCHSDIVTFYFSFSSSRHSNRAFCQDSCNLEEEYTRIKSKNRARSKDLSIFSLDEDENSLT